MRVPTSVTLFTGLALVIGVPMLMDKFCDNSTLPLVVQGVAAIPCFPLVAFSVVLLGIALIVQAVGEMV